MPLAAGVNDITLTLRQNEAVDLIAKWYKEDNEQIFSLAGYAGTGKTTIVRYAIENLGLDIRKEIAFGALTGKAAFVITMKSNGEFIAQTLHSLMYELDLASKVTSFILKSKKQLAHLKLIVVDEASMVSKAMLEDLKYFGIKILAIGDPGQLEPIGDNYSELLKVPDFMLTEIHRQAEGNPIIHLSFLAREKKRIQPGTYGKNAYVISKRDLNSQKMLDIAMRSDQVLVGYNKTRARINNEIRRMLGRTSNVPIVGDKIICNKNNWMETIPGGIALVNGMSGSIVDIEKQAPFQGFKRDAYRINFQPDFTEDIFYDLLALQDDFIGNKVELEKEEFPLYERFNYGYAITVHKSQGSQWPNIFLINEVLNRDSHHRWLYTGITRAEENLIIAA